MRFIAALFLGLSLLMAVDLRAQPTTVDHLPMPDTGGHMLPIWDIAFTPDGRQLVSVSEDKTIRVWDLATGKTVRTIRGESAPGYHGQIYAMALSPNGKWLAVGGEFTGGQWDARLSVRLYDFASGQLVGLLQGTSVGSSLSLAFSPDSRYLISASSFPFAFVWDVEQRQLKSELRVGGIGMDVPAVGLMPDGTRAVTSAYVNSVMLWRLANAREMVKMEGHSAKTTSLAVAADGTIASGDDGGEIRLWDPGSISRARSGERRGILIGGPGRLLARQGSSVGKLSFSPDGKTLLSCAAEGRNGDGCQIYDLASGQVTVTYSGHANAGVASPLSPDGRWHDITVTAIALSPDGRWAATGGGADHEIHIWDARTGQPRLRPDGEPLRLSGRGQRVLAVEFSADGQQIGWGRGDACSEQSACPDAHKFLQSVMTLPSAQSPSPQPRRLDHAAALAFRPTSKTRHGEWSLELRQDGTFLNVKQGEQVTASIKPTGGRPIAYSFTPDGETIISGSTGGTITAHGRSAAARGSPDKLDDFIGHEGPVRSLAFSPDGRFLLSGSADQTLRLWNLKTRELLVTLFYSKDDEWVMWMPQGYYAASGPGAELMGWQINRGLDRKADYMTAVQFRKALNRPDIIARAIQLASAKAAADEAQDVTSEVADLFAAPLPRLRIASPKPNTVLAGGSADVEILLEATFAPMKLIRIQVNGQQVAEHQPEKGGGFAPGALKFTVPLAMGRNVIRVMGIGESGETTADVVAMHDGDGDLDKRGTLYVLAVGVDKYPNLPGSDLRYSGADAQAFAKAMEKHVGPQHQRVVSRLLVNGASAGDAPTAANILNALGMLRQTKETDTVVVFVAGHATNEGPNYRFLPTDAAKQSGDSLQSASVVPWFAFQEAIESAKGRRILFLDTCHAGNSYNQRLSNDSYETNIIIFSAARWDQEALERSDLGHGLFTYALVEGIAGKAKKGNGGPITTLGLRDFLVARVAELASKLKHEQEPQYFRGRDAADYVLVGAR